VLTYRILGANKQSQPISYVKLTARHQFDLNQSVAILIIPRADSGGRLLSASKNELKSSILRNFRPRQISGTPHAFKGYIQQPQPLVIRTLIPPILKEPSHAPTDS